MTKLSKVSFFLFVSVYNYIWLRIILFDYVYNHLGSMGLFGIILLIVVILLFFLLMPKKLLAKNYAESFKKSYFKYFYFIILILECIFGIAFCSNLLVNIFIRGSNPFVIVLFICMVIAILSKVKPSEVMEISTLFNILGYFLLFISLSLFPNLDWTVLLPFKSISYIYLPVFAVMLLADNFSLLICKDNQRFTKLNFIMGIFTALFFVALEYLMLICSAGAEFFKGINVVGFICLSIQPLTKYLGNFEFAYIYFILISCIFKYSFNISVIRNSLSLKPLGMTILFFILLSVLVLTSLFFIPINDKMNWMIGSLLMVSFVMIFWFIKECYFVRKPKE